MGPSRREWLFFHGVLFVYSFSPLVGTRPVPTLPDFQKNKGSNAFIICSFGVETFVLFLSTKVATEKLSN